MEEKYLEGQLSVALMSSYTTSYTTSLVLTELNAVEGIKGEGMVCRSICSAPLTRGGLRGMGE